MLRITVLTCWMLCCYVGVLEAGWHDFVQRTRLDWHRNNAWPQPFVLQDRLSTCAVFVTQAQNGWYAASTLSSLHFNSETQLLTEAGELKVREIVTQHPEQYRTVFVVNGMSEKETSIRKDSIQQAISRILTEGSMPAVHVVNTAPRGWPAEEIDAVSRAYRSSRPQPRIDSN